MRNTPSLSLSSRMALALLASALVAGAGGALAMETVKMLTGNDEVPAVKTSATARNALVIDTDLGVRGSIEVSGMDATAAHIHRGAYGTNGPPVVTLVMSGPTTWSVPAGAKLSQADYDSYKAGGLYVNVHSAQHPAGEIRMQLAP